jgi:hypothetical protein
MIAQPSLPLAPRGRGRSLLSDSTHDRHAGIAACRAGVRFFLAEPSPRRDWRIDGQAWTLLRYPGAVDDPDAGEWISCRTRRIRLDRLRLQPCRHGPADPAPD